jgi:hypothetical protein
MEAGGNRGPVVVGRGGHKDPEAGRSAERCLLGQGSRDGHAQMLAESYHLNPHSNPRPAGFEGP